MQPRLINRVTMFNPRPAIVLMLCVLIGAVCMPAAAADSPTWTQLFPANSPSPRFIGAMAYDPVSQKIVLFGGYDGRQYLNDTWTFDGTNWTQITTTVTPPVRTNASMAFDRDGAKLIMFGGYDGHNYLGDTWLWNGATSTWTQATNASGPTAVTGPMLFPDPVAKRVDNFGGFDGRFYQLTMYQWTGNTWKKLSGPTPSARSVAATSANYAEGSVVMFDGLGDVNPYNTWTWDGTTWTQQFPTVQPESLYSAGAAYDPALKAVIVFGGGTGGVDGNDTWQWQNGQWTQLVPAQSPPPREGHGMTTFRVSGHIIIFGGQQQGQLLNDTWEFTP